MIKLFQSLNIKSKIPNMSSNDIALVFIGEGINDHQADLTNLWLSDSYETWYVTKYTFNTYINHATILCIPNSNAIKITKLLEQFTSKIDRFIKRGGSIIAIAGGAHALKLLNIEYISKSNITNFIPKSQHLINSANTDTTKTSKFPKTSKTNLTNSINNDYESKGDFDVLKTSIIKTELKQDNQSKTTEEYIRTSCCIDCSDSNNIIFSHIFNSDISYLYLCKETKMPMVCSYRTKFGGKITMTTLAMIDLNDPVFDDILKVIKNNHDDEFLKQCEIRSRL
jgi:hypothetical protein